MADIKRSNAGRFGEVDSSNSTTTPLGISGVFTGSFVDVLDFTHITILVNTDQDSATDGLVIQWSADASTVHDSDKYTLSADDKKIYTVGPNARYYRIVYTNGTLAQSTFLIHAIKKRGIQKASTVRVADNISGQDDAELTKSVIIGEDQSNADTFVDVKVNSEGRLLVSQDVTTPADTTEIVQLAQSSISAATDTIYTITNGTTLTIQTFIAGSEENTTGGSKVTLYEDPNGDLSVLNIISALYVNGGSAIASGGGGVQFTGDGTRRIVMRRDTFGGGTREIFGRWKGFEE